ncbi:larval serum protein 1 beta chain-like [Episyrphus balteatus]|uniref:larval serum protein 1 beta chain-like n=1 Tax=Episyrphus balteatus TaxID=286459 RepID=UPI0024868189|nr:larval serum protein 1 beta chain-like [Episyrphus balteatus]
MKLTIVLLACLAAVAVHSSPLQKDVKIADKELLEKQRFFFEILRHVGQPLMRDELMKHGEKLIVDESHYLVYDDSMKMFYETYKMGGLLPKDEFFSVVNKYHIQQAQGLFHFFFQAKDWETLIDNIVWARINCNQGMFVYALNLAVIHRPDMKGIILPSIYEIFPQMFFNSKLIMQAEKFDWEQWNKQIMYEKQWLSIFEKKHMKSVHDRQYHMMDWKMWQWWKLMGLEQDWHLEDKCICREDLDSLKNDSKWTAIWNDMKMIWTPVDYTRDIEIMNQESKLTYLTEDLGWNAYWYYLNMDYSMIVDSKMVPLNKDRRGEWWLYNVQQILARYYMERLSHGMGEISELSWHGHVDMGYDPELIAYNGIGFSMRKNYWQIESHMNLELLQKIMNLERRITDAIEYGKFKTLEGVSIDLFKPESIEIVGNMLQGNMDMVDRAFFGYWMKMASVYLAGEQYEAMTVMPNVMLNYETQLRDPLYYQLLKKTMVMLKSFKKLIPSYKHEELLLPGVTIKDVKVDKMMTYFDLVDFDITNLMSHNLMNENGSGKMLWDKTLLARQMRLNHKPYTVEMMVNSEQAQKVVIRTFLAPEFDEFGRMIDLMKHRENIMEIDAFTYDLVAGENMIKRSSKDYLWTSKDRTTFAELYKMVMMAMEDKNELRLDIAEPHCAFPARLVLPRGWVKGMPMKMIVMISPYKMMEEQMGVTYDRSYLCGIGSGSRFIDNMPLGYPFDRKIENMSDMMVPNMFWKDVKIYHLEKFEKHQMKYENFGTFDYNML